MRIDNLELYGAGTGTGTANSSSLATSASLSTSASLATTSSFVEGSNWISTTNIIQGTTTNPTKGTTQRDYIRYRKVAGKEYEIDIAYSQTGGGSAGSGDYVFSLPGGLTFNTTAHPDNPNTGGVDNGSKALSILPFSVGAAGNNAISGPIVAIVYDSYRFKLLTIGSFFGGASSNTVIKSSYLALDSNSVNYRISFRFTAA